MPSSSHRYITSTTTLTSGITQANLIQIGGIRVLWKSRPKAAYIPFAAGPRMCIGFNFAVQEVKIFLPKLIYRYKFLRKGEYPIEYDPVFQLIRPNNLYVRAERRVKWPPKTVGK